MADLSNNNSFLAQAAHVGWGGFLAFIVPWPIVIVFAFLKELLESLGWAIWEPKQSWSSSGIDFLFWCVGVALAVLLK